ncbi:MAG: hypothetical protein COW40_11150 [Cytophagales bacterium CG17_big_fil_post_rev_8_21_14_2_50_40_13]|nr:MAG: hypothetical protein COW40_11150 [Cytophagales bacterium CG17_big_fil_post_rev_8_21_14_2_50_40_13]
MEKAKLKFVKNLTHIEFWPTGSYQQYLPKGSVSVRLNGHWSQVGKYLSTALVQYERQKANQK